MEMDTAAATAAERDAFIHIAVAEVLGRDKRSAAVGRQRGRATCPCAPAWKKRRRCSLQGTHVLQVCTARTGGGLVVIGERAAGRGALAWHMAVSSQEGDRDAASSAALLLV